MHSSISFAPRVREMKLPIVIYTFLLRSESVLLVRRCSTGFEDGNYGPVGGHLKGRESIKQIAVREWREEIGIEIDPEDLQMIGGVHI